MPRKLSTPSTRVPRTAPLSVPTTSDEVWYDTRGVAADACPARAGAAETVSVSPTADTARHKPFPRPITCCSFTTDVRRTGHSPALDAHHLPRRRGRKRVKRTV